MVLMPVTDKGAATRELILEHAYAIASKKGLEGISIGDLAQSVGMSKSGVFAHFGSREELQLAVLDSGGLKFGERVLIPALRKPRGLPRLRAIVIGWFDWVRDNRDGCLIMGAVSEYDSRPGALRDRTVALIDRWRNDTARAVKLAIEAGELRADTDAQQLAFEISGVAFALHHYTRLFDARQARKYAERAFERLVQANTTAADSTAASSRSSSRK
ncbi:MAG: TetR/AcrR family transcriptional regulator [Gammaproteobacteria bacterium]|nr:MAG: TetR/AcrR family transcriptional regulator [Gammaproteobacteria bacterium]